MRAKTLWTTALVSAFWLPATAGAADLWMHLRVDEREGARVAVNLPVSMLDAVVRMVPERSWHGGRIHIDDVEVDLAELRAHWQEVRTGPDMRFVTVEEGDDQVEVAKRGSEIVVRVHDSFDDERVDVTMPVAVVDALLSGGGDELDVRAALEALAAYGKGELITVESSDKDRVRIWIDGAPEGEKGR